MRRYNFLHSAILIALLGTLSHANSDGFYIGAETTIAGFGDESLKVTNKDKTTTTYKDIEYGHCNIKVGYQHFQGNRVEFYYRYNNLDPKVGDITTKTFGINYEWALSSLSTEKVVPYILIGFGGGKASSSKVKSIDKAEVGEGNLGFGVRYQFNQNIDMQVGYKHTATGFDKFDNDTTDKTSTIDQNSMMLGVAYKF